MLILVSGGSASGKSEFAENRILSLGERRRIYAATMIAWDEECRERIRKHQKLRAGKGFVTVEQPVDLGEAVLWAAACGAGPEGDLGLAGPVPATDSFPASTPPAVLLECLSNLAANELYREDLEENDGDRAFARILNGIREILDSGAWLVVVTNEVFDDGGCYGEETKRFLALLGRLNVELAAMAGDVYEVVCGIPVTVKGNRKG